MPSGGLKASASSTSLDFGLALYSTSFFTSGTCTFLHSCKYFLNKLLFTEAAFLGLLGSHLVFCQWVLTHCLTQRTFWSSVVASPVIRPSTHVREKRKPLLETKKKPEGEPQLGQPFPFDRQTCSRCHMYITSSLVALYQEELTVWIEYWWIDGKWETIRKWGTIT